MSLLTRPMPGLHSVVGTTIIALLALLGALPLPAAHCEPVLLAGRIVSVTDGDTVTLMDANATRTKIRLAGIDAPELHMPFGHKAKAHLSELVYGKEVVAVTRKLDRYGRTLATLMVEGQDANLAMVRMGLAWHYKRYSREQPKDEARAYAGAQALAEEEHLGLWRDALPMAPWDWRHSRQRPPVTLLAYP